VKPGALDKLHGFYQPAPPSWMPQTMGWYVVFGLLLLLTLWAVWRAVARWRRNRYRREALRQVEHADVHAIPALLKRTALAAWPREQVASLSGEPWIDFLETHGGSGIISQEAGQWLLSLDYSGAALTPAEEQTVRQAASQWIRRHSVRA
jgi:hypothetical protein